MEELDFKKYHNPLRTSLSGIIFASEI
jgi:hypothetical protein